MLLKSLIGFSVPYVVPVSFPAYSDPSWASSYLGCGSREDVDGILGLPALLFYLLYLYVTLNLSRELVCELHCFETMWLLKKNWI